MNPKYKFYKITHNKDNRFYYGLTKQEDLRAAMRSLANHDSPIGKVIQNEGTKDFIIECLHETEDFKEAKDYLMSALGEVKDDKNMISQPQRVIKGQESKCIMSARLSLNQKKIIEEKYKTLTNFVETHLPEE